MPTSQYAEVVLQPELPLETLHRLLGAIAWTHNREPFSQMGVFGCGRVFHPVAQLNG